MTLSTSARHWTRGLAGAVIALTLAGAVAFSSAALKPVSPTTLPAAVKALPTSPKSIAELRDIQKQVQATVKQVKAAVVALQVDNAGGSGVIVTKEGLVLTAGHVAGEPGRNVTVILADGRRLKGKTLGTNHGIDSGMIQITDKGEYPFAPLGKSADLGRGQWVIAMGHPGGYNRERPAVVRLGRVIVAEKALIWSDCKLVAGDSGGPLFDLAGNVVGIHSRIGEDLDANIHVPVDTYTQTWDRLVKGENWGGIPANGPMLGVSGADDERGCRVEALVPGGPAAMAGVRPGDIITQFDGKPVTAMDELVDLVSHKSIGDNVKVKLIRDQKPLEITAKLGRRP